VWGRLWVGPNERTRYATKEIAAFERSISLCL
jgi:hypothetical protein